MIRQNIQIDVNRFCRDVKQGLTPSEWIYKFYSSDYDRCDHGDNFTL